MPTDKQQALSALALARQVRLQMISIRAAVRAGDVAVAEALGDPALAHLTVLQVLCWLPRYGDHRAVKLLAGCQPFPIWPTRTCGELTEREREMIGARTR